MKYLSAFFLMFLFFNPFHTQAQLDFRDCYHPIINKAELAITAYDYQQALKLYQQAFGAVETGFGRDYQNAALCAIELEKYDQAIAFLEKLVAKGVAKAYFEENRARYGKLDGHGYDAFLDRYDEIRAATFDQTTNPEVIARLNEMSTRDQMFRHEFETYRDTIWKIDAENAAELVDIVDEYGFPSDEMIGLFSPTANNQDYHLIFVHQMKNWKSDTTLIDLRPMVMDAVRQGKMSPERAAVYLDFAESRIGGIGGYGSSGIIKFGRAPEFYLFDYVGERRETINANRSQIGLFDLDDLESKLRFLFITEEQNSKFKLLDMGAAVHNYPKEVKSRLELKVLE
ncbi:hypothetical protein [Flavilitoribacter nigricans]|uniref:Tetratricopeptide repeat protein n=1 Tax=Flavilitoribacter nigricans (strain ATCC 23147 / DSM 23189 / NBRC 102662 / NCIMB 1420 / SS-2) TaxID=1122177 RepID=A0A2D0N9J6_FLAN2|nr:hypothetical protein [Flavilitoribacter nigricans]PHN05192.1 hypothetical protein CRP01_16875 [Flavilitoribacter nigricans DSM 23189 = NBRC 102662]